MKELSIEEKAKAYDEAIERARKLKEDPQQVFYEYSPKEGETIADYIFPELKESEDEKVRKVLMRFVEAFPYERLENDGVSVKEALAWLEKQGEQKTTETAKWGPQEESCICQLESLVKEQWRHAEKVNNAVDIKKMQELMFFLKTLNPNKKPQRMISAEAKEAMYDKPDWSEEDEEMCQETIDWFEKKCFPYALENENPARESIKWLKSLKNRVLPQPKQEWSEEEQVSEEFINALGTMLNDGLPDRYLVSEERIKKSAELLFSIARKQLKNEMQEWSEEDEKITLSIEQVMNCASLLNIVPEKVDKIRTWLKNLKQRIGG